jgi:UDP-N-acetylglucosamine 4-epimerase
MFNQPYHIGSISGNSFLITGGAGFIGSNLVAYLIKYGAGKIRVLDNLSTGKFENIQAFLDYPGFEWMEGDIRDMDTCVKACQGMQFISHQAALGSVPRSIKDPVTTNEVNIKGHLQVLQAAKEQSDIIKMVYAASSSTYGDSKELPKVEDKIGRPLSPYAVTKFVNELYAQVYSDLYGFHTIGLRYFNVFGPRQDPDGPYAAVIPLFMRAALESRSPMIHGDGEQTRDFTFVENAVQANIRALTEGQKLHKHEVFNIACGDKTSLNQLWNILAEKSGNGLKPTYMPPRQGDIRNSLADIDKAARLLQYKPLFNIEAGLEITLNWYRNEH